jgi:hypothetical protein
MVILMLILLVVSRCLIRMIGIGITNAVIMTIGVVVVVVIVIDPFRALRLVKLKRCLGIRVGFLARWGLMGGCGGLGLVLLLLVRLWEMGKGEVGGRWGLSLLKLIFRPMKGLGFCWMGMRMEMRE